MSFTLGELASKINAELIGNSECIIHQVNSLEKAKAGEISFFANRRYLKALANTSASAVLLKKEDQEYCKTGCLVLDNPYLGFALISRLLNPEKQNSTAWIDPSAAIDTDVKIGSNVFIGQRVYIGKNTVIGDNISIANGVVIGANVSIGAGTKIYPNTVIYDGVNLGKSVIIHAGVVIGADGFGIANDNGVWFKIPQIGKVIIGNDVEIGANTTIDRGALEDTVIGNGVKIDNLVQIGHNVHVGENTAIAGCVAIAGSTHIGKRCMIGGACGISGHIDICDDVILLGMTGVANSIKEPGMYASGVPAMDVVSWRKNMASFKQLYKTAGRLRKLENKKTDE